MNTGVIAKQLITNCDYLNSLPLKKLSLFNYLIMINFILYVWLKNNFLSANL